MALYSNELKVIRQYLSSAVGDLIIGEATGGQTTSLFCATLTEADDYYSDHRYRCYIYDSTGDSEGQERLVTDSSSDATSTGGQLIFSAAYSAIILNGDDFELHDKFTAGEYLNAINLSIESAKDAEYLLDKIDTTTVVLIDGIYEYTVPTSMSYIHRITTEALTDATTWEEADVIDPRNWRLISPRTLKIHEDYYYIDAGRQLRLEGQGVQATVSSDTDTIELPTDWLIQKAITFLPLDKIQSNQLDKTYDRAMRASALPPRSYPDSKAQMVIE